MDQNRRNILVRCLSTVFGKGHDTLIAEVLPLLQTLVNKAELADAVYFVVSGRLRTTLRTGNSVRRLMKITRGETFGAAGVLMKEEHPATIIAVRDSVLARMPGNSI